METVVGLLMALLGVSHAVETYCDGRQDGAQCYGALGGTVILQLTNTSEIERYDWLNETTRILTVKQNQIINNLMENRSSFTPSNGTLRINNMSRNDSGEYRLQIFNSEGTYLSSQTLQMTIQAPVSPPRVDAECLPQGQTEVSCSSEGGDSPQYSWTLDGHTLTEDDLISGDNETDSITLKLGLSGRLVCSVRNHVSNSSKEMQLSTCSGFIFINCTLSNGTHISQWVYKDNNTLCVDPTTTPTTSTTITPPSMGKETGTTVSIKPSTHTSPASQTVASFSTDDPWYIRYLPVIAGSLSVLIVVLVVVLAVYCAQKKKKHKKDEENEDITYADVKIMQRQGKQRQEKLEMEVEYGQVKISGGPGRTVEPTVDECVYAKVKA